MSGNEQDLLHKIVPFVMIPFCILFVITVLYLTFFQTGNNDGLNEYNFPFYLYL